MTELDLEYHLPANRILENYESVRERYYEARFYRHPLKTDCDQCVLLHSNRICIITLSPEHSIIKDKKKISKIDFRVTPNTNRLDNKVSGKAKKGAQKVGPQSVLCRVDCDDNTSFDIFACIQGKIIEINDKLATDYNILQEKTWSDGFIAVILPFKNRHQIQKDTLMTSKEYKQLLEQKIM